MVQVGQLVANGWLSVVGGWWLVVGAALVVLLSVGWGLAVPVLSSNQTFRCLLCRLFPGFFST